MLSTNFIKMYRLWEYVWVINPLVTLSERKSCAQGALCTGKLHQLSMTAKQYLPGFPILLPLAAIIRCLLTEKHYLPVLRSARKRRKAKLWDCGTGNIRWKAFSFI